MDDFKIWFYVILGVVYFLSRLRKKSTESNKEVTEYESTTSKSPTTGGTKPLTFEELLKEITEGKARQQQPVSIPHKTEYADYKDEFEDEDVEEVKPVYKKKKAYNLSDEGKTLAFNRPSLEESVKLQDTVVSFARFKGFEEEQQRDLLAEYTRDLQDPEGFKKAFVMSEILKRRF